MQFPEKVYTETEHKAAKKLIDEGYKHEITIEGEAEFKQKADLILDLIKIAGCYDFFRTYIRKIKEIDGLTQLRETEVAIWANKFAVKDVVDAASLFIQKAYHMKQYIDGEVYYGGTSEKRTVEKRIEFLKRLESKTNDESIKENCERLLQQWAESSLAP